MSEQCCPEKTWVIKWKSQFQPQITPCELLVKDALETLKTQAIALVIGCSSLTIQ